MKVDLNSLPANQAQAERSQSQPVAGPTASSSNKLEDGAKVTLATSSVQGLAEQAMQSPEVRQSKVDAIRRSIASGEYEIDPGKIADAMISNQGE